MEPVSDAQLATWPVVDAEFEILDGEWRGERFDFPLDGIVRVGTLAVKVE
jgi:hypothetical protein